METLEYVFYMLVNSIELIAIRTIPMKLCALSNPLISLILQASIILQASPSLCRFKHAISFIEVHAINH